MDLALESVLTIVYYSHIQIRNQVDKCCIVVRVRYDGYKVLPTLYSSRLFLFAHLFVNCYNKRFQALLQILICFCAFFKYFFNVIVAIVIANTFVFI